MIIGSSHGVGGGPTQTEVLSTVVAQLEPIHATCMEDDRRIRIRISSSAARPPFG